MNKVEDLTGQKFGLLTVLRRDVDAPAGRSKWICRCQCGNIVSVSRQHLTSGNTVSCGCAKKYANLKDITGQRFGKLVAVERTEKKSGHSYVYRCKCDCGNECCASSANLKAGQTTSCGCIHAETHQNATKNMRKEHEKYLIDGTDVLKILPDKTQKNNTSGRCGVHWDVSVKTWKAVINFKNKKYFLGSSRDFETAVKYREEAEEKLHGDFLKWYKEAHPKQWEKIAEHESRRKTAIKGTRQ